MSELTQQSHEKCPSVAQELLSLANVNEAHQDEASQVQCKPNGNKTDINDLHTPRKTTRMNNHHSNVVSTVVTSTTDDQARLIIQPTTLNCPLVTDDAILWRNIECWDPLCHVDYRYINSRDGHMRSLSLPHDLKFVKTSELLPMVYDDFKKYLEEDLRGLTSETNASADDDCVVPSLSPVFQNAKVHSCLDSCTSNSQSSSDWSQEHGAGTDTIERTKKEKSCSPASCGSTYGTLNWGLSPTIIYKTPGPEISVNVGSVPMKCSITEGNVEMITPPQANYSKLRRCQKRESKLHRSRRRIVFDDYTRGLNDEGVQEVPTFDNQVKKESPGNVGIVFVAFLILTLVYLINSYIHRRTSFAQSCCLHLWGNVRIYQEMVENLASDLVPEDPMWFAEDDESEECVKQGGLRIYDDDLEECYANLRNILPKNAEATSRQQILNVTVEHIKELQNRINDLSTCAENLWSNQVKSPDKAIHFQGYEDVFGVLPEFSWSDIDEPSHEIQAILENLVPSTNVVTDHDQSSITPDPPSNNKTPKKRRKCRKAPFSKRRRTRKPKNGSATEKCDSTEMDPPKFTVVDSSTPENAQEMRNSHCSTTSESKPDNTLESTVINSQENRNRSPKQSMMVCSDRNRATPTMELSSPNSSYYPINALLPLQTIGKPLILPKPPPVTQFSPSSTSGYISSTSGSMLTTSGNIPPSGSPLSTFPLIAPRMSMPDSCPSPFFPVSPLAGSTSLIGAGVLPLTGNMMAHAPLTWYHTSSVQLTSSQDSSDSEGRQGEKMKRKTNGYMLYCKKRRASLLIENPELKSKPGDITVLLSQNWKSFTDEQKRPYIEEAIKDAMNSEWINEMPFS